MAKAKHGLIAVMKDYFSYLLVFCGVTRVCMAWGPGRVHMLDVYSLSQLLRFFC